MRTFVTLALLSVVAACAAPPGRPSADTVARVEAELRATLAAFEAAEVERDAEALIAFLDADFTMFQDGQRVGRDATLVQMRTTMPSLRVFEPTFEDVRVLVLAPDAAVTSFVFRDRFVDATGAEHRAWGPSTMVWRRRADGWRMVFADSDHYPVEPAGERR